MPKVKVESNSKHSPEDTYQRIKSLLENDKELRKMDSTYKCQFNDAQMSGTAKGGKFEANMKVTSNSSVGSGGAHVQIEVDLPLMLTPVKGLVQSTLQKKLEHALS